MFGTKESSTQELLERESFLKQKNQNNKSFDSFNENLKSRQVKRPNKYNFKN